jgi:hypothetical protein
MVNYSKQNKLDDSVDGNIQDLVLEQINTLEDADKQPCVDSNEDHSDFQYQLTKTFGYAQYIKFENMSNVFYTQLFSENLKIL